ncbi:MAG TPA: hypothetical protein VGI12_15570, partial [Vicinamibacterales bacterium]
MSDPSSRVRTILLAIAVAFTAWAALVFVTGGIEWRIAGVLLRSRDPFRPLLLAIVLLAVQGAFYREAFARDIDRATRLLRRRAVPLALLVAAAAAAHAVYFGGCTAGGSDSYGYVSQAYGWVNRQLPQAYPLRLSLPFPSGDLMQIPLGHRPGTAPHTMVPTYAPGLPLLMAVGIVTLGRIGPYMVVPVCAALFVWCTFLVGRRAVGPMGGVIAAIVAATTPVVLFQALWPMSDVPAGALWTGGLAGALGNSRRGAILGGVAAALGLLVRPNLLLLAAVLVFWIFLRARGSERFVRAALFSLPFVPVVAAVALLNTRWYGSPLASGYGRSAEIYSLANVIPNLQRYPAWFWYSQSFWILLAFVSLWALLRPSRERPAIALCWAFVLATLVSYITYTPFDDWWYLRFLLPGIGALSVLMTAGLAVAAGRIPRPWGSVLAMTMVLLIVRQATSFALDHSIFGQLRKDEHRYADVAAFVGDNLPENAVVFAMQHSGNIRIWGGRLTLRYDLIDPDYRARIVPELEREGLHPYLGIDDWEAPEVKRHFGLAEDQPLPWPRVAHMRESGGASVYDLASTPQ